MREKLQRFMWGRYGNDRFNQFLMIVSLVCFLLSFLRVPFAYLVALGVLAYSYFRMFSRQTAKRYAENQKYLQLEWKVRSFFQKRKNSFSQQKTHRIYKCPNCGQKLRVPRGRGRIAIRCGKCGTEFVRRS